MAPDDRVASVADRLADLAEELADLALDHLRQATDHDVPVASAASGERRITRARRSVERAVAILRQPGAGERP